MACLSAIKAKFKRCASVALIYPRALSIQFVGVALPDRPPAREGHGGHAGSRFSSMVADAMSMIC